MKIRAVKFVFIAAIAVSAISPLFNVLKPQTVSASTPTYYYRAYNTTNDPNSNPTYELVVCDQNVAPSSTNANCYIPTGSSGNNQYEFQGPNTSLPLRQSIKVDTCSSNNSKATISNILPPQDTQQITVDNYQSAVSVITNNPYQPDWSSPLVCNNSAPSSGTKFTIPVVANITTLSTPDNSSEILGPVKFSLCSKTDSTCKNPLQTVTSGTTPQGGQSNNTLSSKFTSVSPGTYYACVTGINSPCQRVDIQQVQTITFSGTADSSIISNNPSNTNQNLCLSSGGGLSWLTCEVIDGISNAEKSLESLLSKMLQTQPIDLNAADCQANTASSDYSSCIYNVWSQFRIYGDILLVIILLAVIIAEAIGGGLIDAYTVRKVLPRILAAAVLINLSIYLVAGLMDIVNIIGKDIFSFITGPFKATGTFHINITGSGGDFFGTSLLVGTIGAGGTIWALASHGGLGDAVSFLALFVGLAALIAVISVLLTIFFRVVLVILLLMIAPVAFALYAMPNTEKYFRKWWDTLVKTLMVYPIVMVIFAGCNLGAVIVSSFTPSSVQWLGELLAIVGVTIPLFLVPFAFKISGGVVGQMYTAISGIGKRANDAIKGNPNDPQSLGRRVGARFRSRRAEAGLTGAQFGTRINPRNIVDRGRRRGAIEARRATDRVLLGAEYTDADAIYRASKNDDSFLFATVRPDLARSKLGEVQEKLNAARASGNTNGVARYSAEEGRWQQAIAKANLVHNSPAVRMAAFQDLNRTGYQWSPGQMGYNEVAETAAAITGAQLVKDGQENVIGASGQFAGSYAEAMDLAQYNLKSSGGRLELGAPNSGAGWDGKAGLRKLGNYGRGQSKTDTYRGGAAAWLGKDVVNADGKTRSQDAMSSAITLGLENGRIENGQDGVVEYYKMLIRDLPSAIDANKLEIQKQLNAMKGVDNPELQAKLAAEDQALRITTIPDSERET